MVLSHSRELNRGVRQSELLNINLGAVGLTPQVNDLIYQGCLIPIHFQLNHFLLKII